MSLRRPVLLATATLAVATLSVGIAPAHADDSSLTPHTTFTMPVDETNGAVTPPASGEAIPNVDVVKSTIHAYYNVPLSGGYSTQVANPTASPYIDEVAGIEADILAKVPTTAPAKTALVFDTDDTLIWNYNYEDKGSNFNYDSASNAQWVTGKNTDGSAFDCAGLPKTGDYCFPAVPGMPELLATLHDEGYPIYIITGRPTSQLAATVANLTAAGFTDDGTPAGAPLFTAVTGVGQTVFTKDTPIQSWVDPAAGGNAASVSTVEYKAQTRKHIEAGPDGIFGNADDLSILLNVGDQLSDLWGGYTAPDAAVKIPNPTYFLSSANLTVPGPNDESADLTAPDTYTMAADGSSGTTVVTGDDIPNIDPVRAEIRAFYGATNGIANKTKSAYIAEVTSLEKTWTDQIITSCQAQLTKIGAANASVATAATAVTKANAALTTAKRKATKAKKAAKKAHGAAKKKAKRKLRVANRAVTTATTKLGTAKATLAGIKVPGKPAVVFDSDDTTLWNYDMEDGAMKFVFNTGLQNDWVQGAQMVAVPGMPQLVAKVADAGCTVVGLTGRSNDQKYATLGNLVKDGYSDFSRDLFFTKWYDQNDASAARIASKPSYLTCTISPTCSTIEFKSQTRKHIQDDLGYQIVANLGDQFSDLIGGYADTSYKIPNPTYYLP